MAMGENDRRILLLTRERGLISAFARGARRQSNALGAATNPFTFGAFEAFEGRNSVTVVRAEVQEYFRSLMTDLDNVYYASYFLEVCEYYGEPGVDETERLNLLYVTLRALEKGVIPRQLIRRIFELRTLYINGEYPDVFSCTECGSRENLTMFSLRNRGMICKECQSKEDGGLFPVSESLLYALQLILSAPLEKLYSFTLGKESMEEFERLMRAYQRRYGEHKYKSLDFLTNS